MLKKSLAVGIILLFIISSVAPMVFGYGEESLCSNNEENKIYEKSILSSGGPMNSPWPMKCHDLHHTGRSPYSTASNPGIEKWRFKCGWIEDSAIIGDDGTLYFGDIDYYFYALNPDGSLKWKYRTGAAINSAPAIAEDGTIYVGSRDCHLYAFYPNGTLKWKESSGGGTISSSPAIANDGTIYVGTMRGFDKGDIVAFYPNGTKKWIYETGYYITADPAIGDDGTIYIGSGDTYFYAMNPNGTLKWRFKTGDYIKGPSSIAEDGTIYFGSFDDYLYALSPNDTLKWKVGTSWGTSANPSIAEDGTIYAGTNKLRAFFPNGTLKWSFDLGPERWIGSSSPAISADGTIYVGTHIGEGAGGDIIAVNPDGTERWRKKIAEFRVDSSPCITEDGTVYIGSSSDKLDKNGYVESVGYLHAFGEVESNNPPMKPTITGRLKGWTLAPIHYGFSTIDPDNNPVSFYVEWGDGTHTNWTGGGYDLDMDEAASGEIVYLEHAYLLIGRYTIKAKARDVMGEESDWTTLEVSMPKNKLSKNPLFLQLLEKIILRHPNEQNLRKLISYLIEALPKLWTLYHHHTLFYFLYL